MILQIEAHGAQNLLVKRVRVVPDDDEFIDFDEDLHRGTTQSDERQMLNKIYIGQESLKRKQDSQMELFQREMKHVKKTNKALCQRVDCVLLYHSQSRSTANTASAQMYDCQTLHEYWLEYEFGINGHKSVKTFSTSEKRKYKDKTCLRMKLITAVKLLLPHSPAVLACERLERVYKFDGRKSACLLREIGKELKMQPPLPKYFEMYPM